MSNFKTFVSLLGTKAVGLPALAGVSAGVGCGLTCLSHSCKQLDSSDDLEELPLEDVEIPLSNIQEMSEEDSKALNVKQDKKIKELEARIKELEKKDRGSVITGLQAKVKSLKRYEANYSYLRREKNQVDEQVRCIREKAKEHGIKIGDSEIDACAPWLRK